MLWSINVADKLKYEIQNCSIYTEIPETVLTTDSKQN